MANIIVVGAQWGDEGKGKLIDILAKDADYIVRYQGGNNAGHTVVVSNEEIILHLVPSGILHEGKICIIGNGVVLDPQALLDEIQTLHKKGIKVGSNLLISDQAHLIFPYHKMLDKAREAEHAASRIGTTGRGIGPCYIDKVARCGIRVADLLDTEVLKRKLRFNIEEKNKLFTRLYNMDTVSFDEIFSQYLTYRKNISKYIADTPVVLNKAVSQGKNILFEGAQGTLLDIDFGTYPYVTSSSATAGGACVGTGVSPTKIDKVIGVVKAYTTRVGEGPFPTEFPKALLEKVRDIGREFGATTGRPRRCGAFDAVIVKHSVLINGLNEIAVMKLDVLDSLDELKVCSAYRYKGKIFKNFPANIEILDKCKPIYKTFKGWKCATSAVREYSKLPSKARDYLDGLSDLVGAGIKIISVGSNRSQTIYK
ncbi:MAG: adenylosuccinate synthase [Candidatus Omnitrophota bacterium]